MRNEYPAGGSAFDAGMLACLTLLLVGAYTDGWAHNNLAGLDTFFTPWHAMLYSGFTICALYLVAAAIAWHRAGHAWAYALPRGYAASLWGVAIFAAGGVGDLIWHSLFGIEVNVAATVSPTHLTLFLGVALLYLGPLRAALARNDQALGAPGLIKVLSLTYFWMACTFFTQYALPFGQTFSAAASRPALPVEAYYLQALAMSAVLLQAALMIGIVLYGAARFTLPAGALTLAFTVAATATAIMRQHDLSTGIVPIVAAALVAGVLADAIYARLRPAPDRPRAWLAFAALVPFVVFGVYFAVVTALSGTWWTAHLLAGAPIEAAGIGYLVGALTLDRAPSAGTT